MFHYDLCPESLGKIPFPGGIICFALLIQPLFRPWAALHKFEYIQNHVLELFIVLISPVAVKEIDKVLVLRFIFLFKKILNGFQL
ncbi:hypothetical protein SDC9_190149 [bioreactor metagenome]|uniref:Uncharacterized protein n=1 Tax=bioreactor metagenome TaxID=1076179 RepID=A0A645HVV3_9ZZZZ